MYLMHYFENKILQGRLVLLPLDLSSAGDMGPGRQLLYFIQKMQLKLKLLSFIF